MEISEDLKRRLLSELDFVIRKVSEEQEADRKMYFFSAAYGAIERTMRFCLSNELIMAHAILNICYSTFMDRINRIRAGDRAVELPSDWSKQLVEYLSELRELIKEDKSVYPALEKFIRLTHSITGPGYYMRSYFESLTSP